MSALGESPLGRLALGEESVQAAVALSFDLYVDPDTFYDFTLLAPAIPVPPLTVFGGVIGIPPLPVPRKKPRVDVTVSGVTLICVASIIPGKAETISLLSGDVRAGVLVSTKEARPAFMYLVPGDARGTVGFSQEEMEALMLIIAEAA